MTDVPPIPVALEAYLLGRVEFAALLAWQRRLVYDVSGDRGRGVLVLCEVPPLISIGREGSREHIQCEASELHARGWPVQWVNRGGGAVLHAPGQLQITAVLALDALGLGLTAYLEMLHDILVSVVHECEATAQTMPGKAGVWSRGRLLAHVGVAVHDWVAYFGAALNIDPDLELFRKVHCDGAAEPMTSLARERHGPIRSALVRQRLVEAFADRFGFPRTAIFHQHPAVAPVARPAISYRSA